MPNKKLDHAMKELRKAAASMPRKKRKKKFSEESLIKRTRRRLRELYYGEKTYLPKKASAVKTVEEKIAASRKGQKTVKEIREARERARAASRAGRK